jgi:hypothetical protein
MSKIITDTSNIQALIDKHNRHKNPLLWAQDMAEAICAEDRAEDKTVAFNSLQEKVLAETVENDPKAMQALEEDFFEIFEPLD